jgi:hypothetical protein
MRMAIKLLAGAAVVALANGASVAGGSTPGGITLRGGGLYTKAGRPLVAADPDPVIAVTVSAGGRYVVFVRRREGEPSRAYKVSMWIQDRRTGRRQQVGRGLGNECCELATEPDDPSRIFGKFEKVNGAYWSDTGRVLVRFVGEVHVLSMDGSLRGDV